MKLFDGSIYTTFGLLTLNSPDFVGEEHSTEAFIGQANGICGGAVEGGLIMNVGVHTGEVRISVELLDTPPALDPQWEEIVEVSCKFTDTPADLRGLGLNSAAELALPAGTYRARFCGTAYGAIEDNQSDAANEAYLLILWPDAVRPDVIVKATRSRALGWHTTIQGTKQAR